MSDARPLTPQTYRVTVGGAEPRVFELPSEALQKPADRLVDDPAGPRTDRVEPGADRGDGTAARVTVLRRPGDAGGSRATYEVIVNGWRFLVDVEAAARAELRERGSRTGERGRSGGRQVVRAQIPGRIVTIAVVPGDAVERGQRLLSVEAMKMENAVIAPWAGTIARIGVVAGQTVELGDELVVIE